MDKFISQGRFYTDFHQQTVTFYAHLLGVPLVFISLLIVLNFFHLIIPGILDITLAEIGTIVLLAYYIRFSWQLGSLLIPFLALCLWISCLFGYHGPTRFALWSFVIFFVLGLFIQFISYFSANHKLTLDNLWRIALAPIYLMAEVCYKTGFLMKLNEQLHGKEANDEQLEDVL